PLTLEAPSFCKYSKCLSSGTCLVPWNMTCSNRWAKPVFFSISSFDPTLYQTSTTTSGMRWSSCRITSSPLGSAYFSNGIWGSAEGDEGGGEDAVGGAAAGEERGGISAVVDSIPWSAARGRSPSTANSLCARADTGMGAVHTTPPA